jgi:DNA ligase-associated metallophosphoesterase
MSVPPVPGRVFVADNVLLDGRLALFHQREGWLAVADLHFGYELSQRAAGSLVPLWGMDSIRERLLHLLADYEPSRLIVVGDIVHDRTAAQEAQALVREITRRFEVVLIAGNHDRNLAIDLQLLDHWDSDVFRFHHGHCATELPDRIQIIGHHHPAGTIRDGAGLHLKLPAFVQQEKCWIMPAFSPWAAGATWPQDERTRMWLCTPNRILPLHRTEAVA